ncbi:hypothetical protein, partial [Phocaeicola sp.]|uniref:hypothetical protein n=1 Tax=Phocaeicola sp. TaxID=2773926 RepID=UPI00307BF0ED
RPPAPKAGALTGLRYTPNGHFFKTDAKVMVYFVTCKFLAIFFFQSKHIYFLRHLTFDGLYLPFRFCYLPNNPLSSSSQPLPASS